MLNKEEIILKILNEDVSSWVHLMNHDRKRISQTIVKALDSAEEANKEQKQKETSDEILAKLNILIELKKLHDELKKIPFYKLSERDTLKWKIIELDVEFKAIEFCEQKDINKKECD